MSEFGGGDGCGGWEEGRKEASGAKGSQLPRLPKRHFSETTWKVFFFFSELSSRSDPCTSLKKR